LGGWLSVLVASAGLGAIPFGYKVNKRRITFGGFVLVLITSFAILKNVDDAFIYRMPEGYIDLNRPEVKGPVFRAKLPYDPKPRTIRVSYQNTELTVPFKMGEIKAYMIFEAGSIELNPKERDQLDSWLQGKTVPLRLSEELSLIAGDNMANVAAGNRTGILGYKLDATSIASELERRSPFVVKGEFKGTE
jgi:hypothetical protein